MAKEIKIIEKHKMSIDWPCTATSEKFVVTLLACISGSLSIHLKFLLKGGALMRRRVLNEGGPIKISCQQTK